MKERDIHILRCPATRTSMQLKIISLTKKIYDNCEEDIINEGILFSEGGWIYPVIGGIPRLLIEAFEDYRSFFYKYLPDYKERKSLLQNKYKGLVRYAINKNRRTKKSFSQEWKLYDFEKDKTWNEDAPGMLQRFFKETEENSESLEGKLIFDAGCGNGLLDILIAEKGATILAMDFSLSIERAYGENADSNVIFIQGDLQFPPVAFEYFDIVHCSGVLIHTNNTELSFSCLEPCVKKGGKLSVWLYHPKKDIIHNLFNFIRRFTSKLPIRFQYYLYAVTIFPASFIIKRLKRNKQNAREIMIDILDWFSPEFRWEHSHEEAVSWFKKHQYHSIKITTTNEFGFNIIGIKHPG